MDKPKSKYEESGARKAAWSRLKQCPEFKEFFLDYWLARRADQHSEAISRNVPIEQVPARRAVRDEIESIIKEAGEAAANPF